MKNSTLKWLDIDSIYLSSKYPVGSALPNYYPDESICLKCLKIMELVKDEVNKIMMDKKLK